MTDDETTEAHRLIDVARAAASAALLAETALGEAENARCHAVAALELARSRSRAAFNDLSVFAGAKDWRKEIGL